MRTTGERGQATVEYVGVVALVAVLLSVVVVAARPGGIGEAVAARMRCAIGGGCGGGAREPVAAAAGAEALDPALRAWVLEDYRRDPFLQGGRPLRTPTRAPVARMSGAWKTLVCASQIALAVASAAVPVWRVVALVRFVRAVGGVRMAARLLTGATTWAEKIRELAKYVGAAAGAIMGIEGIRDKC